MSQLSRTAVVERVLALVEARSDAPLDESLVVGGEGWEALSEVGRITVAFHPDRLDRRGLTTARGLHVDGGYLPQWLTGASSGSRSALPGGLRADWEAAQFAVDVDVPLAHRPVYGALDLLHHRHGGSPAFGSCYLVLHDHVRARCTLSVGDSHLGPAQVGTFRRPEAILSGLIEQASAGGLLGQDLDRDDLRAVLAGQRRGAPRRSLDFYVEAQVHGGVRLEDIAAIVVDPSFSSSPIAAHLERAAEAADARLEWHPGTAIVPSELATHPTAIAWVDDDDYLTRLAEALERLAAPSRLASAADIGQLTADTRPGPPTLTGDEPRSVLQRVKHLWRLTYLLGRDAAPGRLRARR